MRKVDDGEERNKRMLFIVATNVVASQPPERQPTGMLTTCANNQPFFKNTAKLHMSTYEQAIFIEEN